MSKNSVPVLAIILLIFSTASFGEKIFRQPEVIPSDSGELAVVDKGFPVFKPALKGIKKSPFLGVNPVTGYIEMVYEYTNLDEDSEIFHTYWDPNLGAWMPPFQITSNGVNDRDPRIAFRQDGKRYCVWWAEDQVSSVYMSSEELNGEIWSAPETVTAPGMGASHPNILFSDDKLIIFYEGSPGNSVNSASDGVRIIYKQEGIPMDEEPE